MIMAEVVLYHHVQGLTKGVEAFADDTAPGGSHRPCPRPLEGRTFTTLEDGIAHARQVGFDTIQERGIAAAEALDPALVYTGFSLGVMPAQQLAQTRAGARGALLFHACLPVSEFGESWPVGVPVQIHGMDSDAEFVGGGDLDAARALVDSTDQAELFLYPGDKHLFADSSLPSHDEAAATLLTSRALDFLEGLPRPTAP